ncbi:TPA: hypothetical protein ACNYHX_001344 [Streptococcus pyogenes]|uniref:hypothetical protein n=1 Tax=Streptococcus pyogenes TaxID=1314 RepID=UPI000252E503|nr:hypothetical protein [Streptococcus pyogenes]HER4563624.1 hypothetical protein [Streptococcus pyogenes NGAS639]HER4697628.1 hypothetical protein [Streptococcus pyogenes NGAS339]HER4708999.1 hypothetical protein [Streptococcus pyogenes NGAS321]AFC66812.1 hypothetical protein MGAS15252_1500 [Streptococcus pyogenes MGAS15252]AFC68742.1 hypothetical protein MGAS1882_1561 [Streptococcus pyogenes MGAS1882]
MTTMQKTVSLLSLALLIGLLGTSGKAISVYAQDQHTDNVIAESTISQVSVEASMRGTEPYIDATVTTDQPVRQPTQATITLKDASDNTINSWVYTMAAQQRRFTAWFDLTGQKSGDYHVTVTVHTQEKAVTGQSGTVYFDQNKSRKTPTNMQQKDTSKAMTNSVDVDTKAQTNQSANQEIDSTSNPFKSATNHRSTSLKRSTKNEKLTPTASNSQKNGSNKTKMLVDKEEVKPTSKRGFPWVLSGLVVSLAAGLFIAIQKVSRRK